MKLLVLTLKVGMAVMAAGAAPLLSQTPPAPKQLFEVVSVKQDNLGRQGPVINVIGDRLLATNMSLTRLVEYAYRSPERPLLANQIIGAPGWSDTDHFDIEAKLEGGARTVSFEQRLLMLQSVLEDRFQLKVHRETREFPVYALLVAKKGPKLKVSADQTFAPPPPASSYGQPLPANATVPRGAFGFSFSGSVNSSAVSLSQLIDLLRLLLGQHVLDKTGLTGLFDITMHWAPGSEQAPPAAAPNSDLSSPSANALGPSLFTALQEQLGLRLESQKAPLEVLVIDSVQKPSEN